MIKVTFYDEIEDSKLAFAVIVARTDGKWVFCKHKERDTFEIPGGHREYGETIDEAARRELYEETGALEYSLSKVGIYSVIKDGDKENESFGMLYYADIYKFEEELHSEIEKIIITENLIEHWTYPEIQPKLIEYWQGSKISLCGDNCLECPRYNAKNEEELRAVAELWYKVGWRDCVVSNEEIACHGCSSHKQCTYQLVECVKVHGVTKCNQCNEFPCMKIENVLERSAEYKRKCKELCSEQEYIILEKAFFEKEKNLKSK